MPLLAQELGQRGVVRSEERELRRYRQFYQTYPQIRETLPPETLQRVPTPKTGGTVSRIEPDIAVYADGQTLITRLSFSHIAELITLSDDTQRRFYELECLRGNWSVRELKRQMGSLYYERSGLSHDKQQLAALAQQGAETETTLNIRDPYVFEFLGLKPAEVMSESHLEPQLTEKLQDFLLRFNNFNHENIGQLNTYVNWYRANMMTTGDNPPVGILLCTGQNHALAEFALAGMDNQLFVSKYQLELPKKEDMQRFMDEQFKEVGGEV